jgi:putative ABC transport system permease protein
VGSYPADFVLGDGSQEKGFYTGIDRINFPSVAFWQDDFASQELGELMNALGSLPEGVLVSREYMDQRDLSIGNSLRVNVQTGGALPLEFKIVGVIDLFPTWYPEQGPLVVGNLDYLYAQAGGEFPHQVWLDTTAEARPEEIVSAVRGFTSLLDVELANQPLVEDGLNTFVRDWTSATQIIVTEQRRPERQGLFGLLSVGFITSALLTVLGFLLYAIFSFRRRFIELGMLRAIGLSAAQMTALLAAELAFLLGIGLAVGTIFGVGVSQLFIPFLQVGAEMAERFPPFVVRIAWLAIFEMYVLFIFLFVAALFALVGLLLRMKIFQAVKLGETI